MYAYDLKFEAAPTVPSDVESSVDELLQERAAHSALLHEHLAAAQNRMKMQADRNRTDREFQVGDEVLLKLQPYTQSSVVSCLFPKLAFKFFGPFTVLERFGKAAYKLQLPDTSQIQPVFHVSQLKPFTPDYTRVFKTLPSVVDLSSASLLPEAVLDRRLVKRGNAAIPQVLVKWRSIPVESATWEDYNVVSKKFLDAIAWGQATPGAGGGVTAQA